MPDYTLILIILSALVSLGLAAFQYLYGNRRSARYFWVLALLKAVGIFSVLLLLINPEFVTTTLYPEKPTLVLAVDNSASIEASGRGGEVRQLVKELTSDADIRDHFNVQSFSFGKDLKKAEELDFSETHTNIQGALSGLRSLFKNSTAPTVLITDGNQTFGSDYRFGFQN